MSEVKDVAVRKFQKELNAGTVALVLLSVLHRSQEPLYGYQIAKRLEEAETGGVAIKQGTLYPVLRSLEGQGLLASRVEPSVSGPPRKYYSITGEGIEVLDAWTEAWRTTREFVDRTLEGGRG
ncbi:MAG: PadR family transcriptional regulator [Coriobacteriia bacterium]